MVKEKETFLFPHNFFKKVSNGRVVFVVTRPDTRLPKSRAGGQGPNLRSPDYLGRGSEVKEIEL